VRTHSARLGECDGQFDDLISEPGDAQEGGPDIAQTSRCITRGAAQWKRGAAARSRNAAFANPPNTITLPAPNFDILRIFGTCDLAATQLHDGRQKKIGLALVNTEKTTVKVQPSMPFLPHLAKLGRLFQVPFVHRLKLLKSLPG
jgi:hypothetical protein